MNCKFICSILLALVITTHAQEGKDDNNAQPELQEYDFKEVSKAELRQKYHPKDSVAPAAIIYEKGEVDFMYNDGWEYKREVTRRIKIYSKDGYDYANIKIPYYYPSTTKYKEHVRKVKAYTYNLEKGKVVDERVRKRDMIDVEKTDKYQILKFTFPKVEPGSVIEYRYTLVSPHITRLNDWSFQHDIPTNQSVYRVSVPEAFGYSERAKGYHQVYRSESSHHYNMKISYERANYRRETGTKYLLFNDYVYYAMTVPKMKDEPFVNNQDNFKTSIDHELAYTKNLSNNKIKYLTKTWEDVALDFYDDNDFGDELGRTRYFEDDLDKLISEYSADEAKIEAIFELVRSRVKWNGDNRLYCSDKLKRIYRDGKGNSADINLMLTSMLRYAGFNANPILVSTISHGFPHIYPSRTHFNYIVSGVELDNGKLLKLDASSKFTKPGQLPYRCLNWNGRLIRRNGTSKQVSLNPKKPSRINYSLYLELHQNGKLTGKVRKQFTDQLAYNYRVKMANVNEQKYIDNLKNDLDIEITEHKKDNVDNLVQPIVETFSFTKENGFDQINDKIYFSPLSFLATKENPFKQDRKERNFPINFTYPKSQRMMINIDIPEGYSIEYMPEKTAVALPDNAGVFRYNINQSTSGAIQVVIQKDINQPIFAAEFYEGLKRFYTEIVEKETDKIVLTKT